MVALNVRSQIHRDKGEWWSPGAGGRGNGELVFHGNRISIWEDEEVLEMDGSGDGCRTM